MTPEMPKDWWPDQIFVRGRHQMGVNKIELAFVMTPFDANEPRIVAEKLDALRRAIWNEIHSEETV
jgi:hypothetical protein